LKKQIPAIRKGQLANGRKRNVNSDKLHWKVKVRDWRNGLRIRNVYWVRHKQKCQELLHIRMHSNILQQ
jgi:hypothetical protein